MPLFLSMVVLLPTAAVAAAISVLRRARTPKRDHQVTIVAATALTLWSVITSVLAYRGFFQPLTARSIPPIGITLAAVLVILAASLILSASLRRLLSGQANLIRIHLWRLEGVVFLVLMVLGQMPALWALPAGIGDILVGATAFWVARHIDTPQGRRRAIIFNLFGMADLIVAVGLGVTTNPRPAQLFLTTPSSELITCFPLALVPTLSGLSGVHDSRGFNSGSFSVSDGRPCSVERRKSSRTSGPFGKPEVSNLLSNSNIAREILRSSVVWLALGVMFFVMARASATAPLRPTTTPSGVQAIDARKGDEAMKTYELAVERIEVASSKSFEESVAYFEKRIPAADPSVFTHLVSSGASADEIERSVQAMVGDLGFMTLARINQGPLVSHLGKPKKMTVYLVGNPVLANRMYEEDPATGLYAPLRVAIYEDYRGVTHLTYDRPSSLLHQFPSPNIRAVAEILDQRMSGLAGDLSE